MSAIIFSSCVENVQGSESQPDLNIYVVDESGGIVEGVTVEIFESAEDRNAGRHILLAKNTDNQGKASFSGKEINKTNRPLEEINGRYYLNLYKHNLRQQAETDFLDFTKDHKISQTVTLENVNAEIITVKVAVVYENPVIQPQNKRIHELFITPGYSFSWNDPVILSQNYEKALEEASGYTVDYQVVQEIDASQIGRAHV